MGSVATEHPDPTQPTLGVGELIWLKNAFKAMVRLHCMIGQDKNNSKTQHEMNEVKQQHRVDGQRMYQNS